MRVGILDSGLGGLSLYTLLKKHIPMSQVFYVCDHRGFPYGPKDPQWVTQRVIQLVQGLMKKEKLHTILIGCHTATTAPNCLEYLKTAYSDTSIIGLTPAIKPAIEAGWQTIGILATEATNQSTIMNDLILTYGKHKKFMKKNSPRLVVAVEDWLSRRTPYVSQQLILEELAVFEKIDGLVLACSHFFHIKNILESLFPSLPILEPSEAVIREVRKKNFAPTPSENVFLSTCWTEVDPKTWSFWKEKFDFQYFEYFSEADKL